MQRNFVVSASIFSFRCDGKQELIREVSNLHLIALVLNTCAVLIINLQLFNLLIDDYELGQKVYA